MDKNAIKNYAIWARKELIARVSQKALQYGFGKDTAIDPNASAVNGRVLTNTEKQQRAALIEKINSEGYEQVIEEVAYTWFNRFIALRFMEVNDYLPTHIRVFSDETGAFNPQIMAEAINLQMDGLDIAKVYAFKENDQDADLFKYLVITQCNALNKVLPGMFQRIADYTELLFPDHLLEENSAVGKLVNDIPEEDWKDAVQIIGWLYQFYIAEPKDVLINARKAYKKDDIPFVTQLFTPDWIVRYMVENSLGRLWLEGHPQNSTTLKSNWAYFLDEAEQNEFVKKELNNVYEEYAGIKPQDLRCIDPCEGSGHIIVYIFDVLVQIYSSYGYTMTDAVASIVKNNLYGLDIDDRAAQLAYFAVMMKARQYDSRFLARGIQPHVYSIIESNSLDRSVIEYFVNGDECLKKSMDTLVRELHNAKEYGSILNVSCVDFEAMRARFDEIRTDVNMYAHPALEQLLPFVQVAQTMAQKYDVIVTNPPYMNSSYMPADLKSFVETNYVDYKSDLFAAFTKKALSMTKKHGHIALLTPYVWMFIQSYEKMRINISQEASISSLVQLEYNAFEAACVPVAAFSLTKASLDYAGQYIRLSNFRGADNQGPKVLEAIAHPNCGYRFTAMQSNFSKIPGAPVAYWVKEKIFSSFGNNIKLGDFAYPKQGLATADNKQFLRLWFEVDKQKTSFNSKKNNVEQKKWFPHNKGGEFRKWYGNRDYVINWENDGAALRSFHGAVIRNPSEYFKDMCSYSDLTSGMFSFRYFGEGFIFDSTGPSLFNESDEISTDYLMGVMNSCVINTAYLTILCPTMHYTQSAVAKVPIIVSSEKKDIVSDYTKVNVSIAKKDWDSFETSWDFKKHPLVPSREDFAEARQSQFAADRLAKLGSIQWNFEQWKNECENRFNTLKKNEEELNRIFIDIYGLQDELTPDVEDKDVTVRKADLEREIKSLISYAVGCMFGRYSLDREGLVYAGGDWDVSAYNTFEADADNIIPICDDEYFSDDIVGRFIEFLKVAYGTDSLEDNLKFIAGVLGGKGTPREVIRQYFLNDFFKDHCDTYQVTGSGKRPIYWLFDSGKKNGFKCLIYMHRYKPDTIARIRTDYVHEQQSRYDTAIDEINAQLNSLTGSNLVNQKKRLAKLMAQKDEIHAYEEKIHHLADQMISIDLDDGVKVNYAKFKDVLAKIK